MKLVLVSLLAAVGLPLTYAKCLVGDSCFPSTGEFKVLEKSLTSGLVYPSNVLKWRSIGPASLHNGRLDEGHEPYVATFATTADDVKKVMKFVQTHDLLFSVKSTGHCYSGNCMVNDSFHLDLTKMNDISYDAATSTIIIEPGSNFDALYELNEETGTQSVGGMCGTVGPVGFSLGGGHGPLIRSYGLGADQIVSANMVLSSGEAITVTEDSDKELFWALRGGGGGTFGVVTSITLKTYKAPEQLISYTCNYPLKMTSNETVGEEILGEWWSKIMPALPNEWSFFSILLPQPIPIEMDIPEFDGKTMKGLASVEGLFNGADFNLATSGIQRLVDLAPEHQMSCSFSNHTSLKAWHDTRWFGKVPMKMRNYMATSFAQEGFNGQKVAKLTIEAVIDSENTMSSFFGIQTGGMVKEEGSSTSAVSDAFRGSEMLIEADANWVTKMSDEKEIDWTRDAGDNIHNLDDFKGAYVNEPDPQIEDYEDRFWGDNFAKLQDVKKRIDKANVLGCWQCVYSEEKPVMP